MEDSLVTDLRFDRNNPRLIEFGITEESEEDEILRTLWTEMDVRELVLSMAASGYFAHEPLIVSEENGERIVIEGNRRLAALKVLTQPRFAGENKWTIPEISEPLKVRLESVPTLRQSREASWRYMGFKHVNGPAKWTSFAKANYIAEVRRNYGVGLSDIARQIGDNHGTVQKLFRALMVLEQAERAGVYDRADCYASRIFFSHLYTGLEYDGFGRFLNLAQKEDETDSPVSKDKISELGELLTWLFGSKKSGAPSVIESQNPDLRQLNEVVDNREAISALRAGESLGASFLLSRPAGAVLEDALLDAKRALMRAKSYVANGYDGSESLLKTAGSVATLADAVYEEMDVMRNGNRKKLRIIED